MREGDAGQAIIEEIAATIHKWVLGLIEDGEALKAIRDLIERHFGEPLHGFDEASELPF